MIEEELPDELENDLDDIEPVGDASQLYEHFRVVVDKGQAMVRVDKYVRTYCQCFAQPYSEGCRRRIRYGQWQAGEE